MEFLTDNKEYLLWIALTLLLWLLIYLLYRELSEKNVLGKITENYRLKAGQRFREESRFFARYGKLEEHSYVYRIDRLLLCAGIKELVPKATAGRFLLLQMIMFAAGSGLGMSCFKNILAALFLGAFAVTMIHSLLLAMYGIRYNRIEDDTAVFVSILMNYAKGSSDIVNVMEYTANIMEGPMQQLCGEFLNTANRYGNADIAFDYVKEAIDNRQLQMILINLKNCMHYEANYEEVLSQMMGQITAGLTAREERKNILFSMKFTLTVISAASLLIVALIGSGLGIDVLAILTANTFGQLLMFITGILYLFVFLRLFGTDR